MAKFSMSVLLLTSFNHFLILCSFVTMKYSNNPEIVKYQPILIPLLCSFESFFGIYFLRTYPSPEDKSTIEHVILLIANGAVSSQMISIIDDTLCLVSFVWWSSCLIAELVFVRKQLWIEICSKWCPTWICDCCLPITTPAVERNEEEYTASVKRSIEEEYEKAMKTANLYQSLLSNV
jgi:hypothetical protein